jgi:RNA polymerase sigma factor (TIGR02999 family)
LRRSNRPTAAKAALRVARRDGAETIRSGISLVISTRNTLFLTATPALRRVCGWRTALPLHESTGCQMDDLTELLGRMQCGDVSARDALFSAAYPELRRLAHARLRDGGRNTVLDTTALVHESYLRFVHSGALRADHRRAFFAYASQVMRSVIVNLARERQAQKRGGNWQPVTLSTDIAEGIGGDEEAVLKVHEALDLLEQIDSRLAQVTTMRYFGGYTEEEIAQTLDVGTRTVRRSWEQARLMLQVIFKQL